MKKEKENYDLVNARILMKYIMIKSKKYYNNYTENENSVNDVISYISENKSKTSKEWFLEMYNGNEYHKELDSLYKMQRNSEFDKLDKVFYYIDTLLYDDSYVNRFKNKDILNLITILSFNIFSIIVFKFGNIIGLNFNLSVEIVFSIIILYNGYLLLGFSKGIDSDAINDNVHSRSIALYLVSILCFIVIIVFNNWIEALVMSFIIPVLLFLNYYRNIYYIKTLQIDYKSDIIAFILVIGMLSFLITK